MEIILYDVVLPKLVGPNLLKSYRRGNRPMYFDFTPSKKLKLSNHTCVYVYTLQ